MFRDRFWLSLILSAPVIVSSQTIQEWCGYTAPDLAGHTWIAPVWLGFGQIDQATARTVGIKGLARRLRAVRPARPPAPSRG